MSTIKSSDEHLTLNADGSSKDIKFQANGVEKASIDSSGNLTVSGNLTSVGIDDNADATAMTITSAEKIGIGTSSPDSIVEIEGASPILTITDTDATGDNLGLWLRELGSHGMPTDGTAYGAFLNYKMADNTFQIQMRNGSTTYDALTIARATGAVTMPSQPCVSARASYTDIPINTVTVITLDNERFDIGSNLASSTFTAPVTGKYLFTYTIYFSNVDTAATSLGVQTVTSNRQYENWFAPDHIANTDFYYTATSSQIADMDANDTLQFKAYIGGGSTQTDVHADSQISITLIA